MKLWIEHACQGLTQTDAQACDDVVRTFQTEEQFFVILASAPRDVVDNAADMLQRGTPFDTVVETVLADLPDDERASFAILQVVYDSSGACQAYLAEFDAPPLFLIRERQVLALPASERTVGGRTLRLSHFALQDGDYAALVSRGYLHPRGWGWDWNDVAVAARRLCAVCCDAGELVGAMVRTFRRLNPEMPRESVSVVATSVRPIQTATVWTGPPSDPALDEVALDKLMAERGTRILCGGTTGQIAARLLGAELELEPRPQDGWSEVPPASSMEQVDMVTEGLVTLDKARERLAGAKRANELPRKTDGATRLARALLAADKIHFIVGMAVNPQQTDGSDSVPLRRLLVKDIISELETYKLVSVEYL